MIHAARWWFAAALLSVACAVVVGSPADATALQVGLSPQRLSRIDAWAQDEISKRHKAGVIVLIARHGRIAHQSVHGMADIAAGKPLRADALFRLYSMTKPITSVALLTLYEQGKFQLTDALEDYIPAFKNVRVYAGTAADGSMVLVAPTRKITIEDVFRHTAGFSYGYFGDTPVDHAYREAGVDYAKVDSLKELIDRLAAMPLLYQPGERWVYSFAHDVQAYLVEYFSGLPFDEYCRRTIFKPLRMNDTVFGVPEAIAGRFAQTYGPNAGHDALVAIAGPGESSGATPDAYARYTTRPFCGMSLSSTAGDYFKFSQMLLNRGTLHGARILSPKTVELMTSNHLPPGMYTWNGGAAYGLGVEVIESPALNGGMGTPGRYGWGGLATTSFFVDPTEDMVGVMLSQYLPQDSHFIDTFKTLAYQTIVVQSRASGSSPTSASRARR